MTAAGARPAAARIAETDPGAPEARRLLDLLDGEMAPHYALEQRFGYSVETLRARGVRLFLAWRGGRAVGCAGLEADPPFGELKRMFVVPEARGTGAADALMDRIEAEAEAMGLPEIRLETGIYQHAAIGFYRRRGYREVAAWGAYAASATSLCMQRRLR